jgi:hypothetical protein
MSAAWLLVAASISSTCALAQTRPVTPGWQELTVNKEGSGVAVQSRIDTDVISLKLSGGQVEVRRTDIPTFAVDKVNLSLDHMALTDVVRGKGADAALAAYRDFVTADLVKRGWKEATAERAKFSAGGKAPAIYWAAQAEGSGRQVGQADALPGSGGRRLEHRRHECAGRGCASCAGDQALLTDSLATLEAKKGTALGGEGVGRLRQETQRLVHRMASRVGVILLNDDLASQQDRQPPKSDVQQLILSPSDMVEAAAAAVEGSPNRPFITFLYDGRSQHAINVHGYTPPPSRSSIRIRPARTACSRPAEISRASRRCASPTRRSGCGWSRRASSRMCCRG